MLDIVKEIIVFAQQNSKTVFGAVLFYIYCGLFIPVMTYRLLLAPFTGNISWRPLAKNYFNLKESPFKFWYFIFFTLFADILSLLALFAVTRVIIRNWPDHIPV